MADIDQNKTWIFEEEDSETAARLDAEAELAIAAGQVVPHEKVVAWFKKHEKGERVLPPKA